MPSKCRRKRCRFPGAAHGTQGDRGERRCARSDSTCQSLDASPALSGSFRGQKEEADMMIRQQHDCTALTLHYTSCERTHIAALCENGHVSLSLPVVSASCAQRAGKWIDTAHDAMTPFLMAVPVSIVIRFPS
eukprot:4025489-Prymnesium_polylepis.1